MLPDLTDKSLSTLVNSMDYLLENDWLTISGGILGLIIWLSSFLSAIIGASFWDSLEWVKGKTEGNTCYTLVINFDFILNGIFLSRIIHLGL